MSKVPLADVNSDPDVLQSEWRTNILVMWSSIESQEKFHCLIPSAIRIRKSSKTIKLTTLVVFS